nr:MAG TPA: hypothetical protein [Bacteriophage sp.]
MLYKDCLLFVLAVLNSLNLVLPYYELVNLYIVLRAVIIAN